MTARPRTWAFRSRSNWDLGGATLTSITAYRDYQSGQPGDIDYSRGRHPVTATARASSASSRPSARNCGSQGTAFDGRFDWLVGAYFADEDLTVTDNLRFGNQYGRFATCRLVAGSALAALYSPTSPGCLAARPAAVRRPPRRSSSRRIDRLDGINDRGSTPDVYRPEQPQLRLLHPQHHPYHRSARSHVRPALHQRAQALRRDLRQRQYRLPAPADEPHALPRRPRARGGGGRPDRPFLPGQFDGRAQRRHRSTTAAARTSSPAPACSPTGRTTT